MNRYIRMLLPLIAEGRLSPFEAGLKTGLWSLVISVSGLEKPGTAYSLRSPLLLSALCRLSPGFRFLREPADSKGGNRWQSPADTPTRKCAGKSPTLRGISPN